MGMLECRMAPNGTRTTIGIQTPPKPRWEMVLMGILQDGRPEDYQEQLRQQIESGRVLPGHALTFPLSRSLEKRLTSLPHHNPEAPDTTRDERLVAWFEACKELGADPLMAVRALGEHASGGFVRLMKMKAVQALLWWRGQGVEEQFEGPVALDKASTTFPTLALLYGYPEMVDTLLPGSRLTHVDRLWHAVWHKRTLGHIEGLIERLWAVQEPPRDALAGLAQAPVNLKNIDGVLAIADKLIAAGCDPSAHREGQTSALAQALEAMCSPASAQLVQFLIERGADPLGRAVVHPTGKTSQETSALELALHRWQNCPKTSHLVDTMFDCFATMARATPAERVRELFPAHKQVCIVEAVRKKYAEQPAPWRTQPQRSTGSAVAMVEALWLDLGAPAPAEPSGRRVRL